MKIKENSFKKIIKEAVLEEIFGRGARKGWGQRDGDGGGDPKAKQMPEDEIKTIVDLWANLGWEKGGKQLWNYIRDIPGLEILSAPMAEGSKVGKRIWVERELGLPASKVNLADSKKSYGEWNGKQGLLVDDRDKYVNEFRAGGGIAIKHDPNNVDNTIKQLQKYGF